MAPAPTTPNAPAKLNRALLTVFGLLLVLAGAYAVLRGVGALATGTLTTLGLPAQDAQASLLPQGLSAPSWVPIVVIVAAVIIGLLCLRWLLAQTRRRASGGTWRFDTQHSQGDTRMDSDAAAAALSTEVESYTGVHSARAVLTGDRHHPELHLTVGVTEQTPVAELRRRIDAQALPRLRQALELDTLPTEILLRLGVSSNTSRTT